MHIHLDKLLEINEDSLKITHGKYPSYTHMKGVHKSIINKLHFLISELDRCLKLNYCMKNHSMLAFSHTFQPFTVCRCHTALHCFNEK